MFFRVLVSVLCVYLRLGALHPLQAQERGSAAESGGGPRIAPEKGYAVREIRGGLYWVSDGAYNTMFFVTSEGVVAIDAPPTLGAKYLKAISEVTSQPVVYLIYSHEHTDHIGAANLFPKEVQIIAQRETARILTERRDPRRPLPTIVFDDKYVLSLGGETLVLEYPGINHERGNIFIFAPRQKTLMLVDVVFPGWMMWRRFALAQDIPGYFETVRSLDRKYDYKTLIGGHLNRVGTKEDVSTQLAFMTDLHAAAANGLSTTKMGEGMSATDKTNAWAVFDNYIDRVTIHCVNAVTPRWKNRLAAFDVFIYDQCLSMEQSLRVDGPSM